MTLPEGKLLSTQTAFQIGYALCFWFVTFAFMQAVASAYSLNTWWGPMVATILSLNLGFAGVLVLSARSFFTDLVALMLFGLAFGQFSGQWYFYDVTISMVLAMWMTSERLPYHLNQGAFWPIERAV